MKKEVHIGNLNGLVAIWCDETEAVDLANLYGPRDTFSRDIMQAVEAAYPKDNTLPEGIELG